MRITKWGGLLTNASTYAIPPGGATAQINLQSIAPGQLSVRGGMRAISFTDGLAGSSDIRELYRYAYGSSREEKLVVLDANGIIQVVSSPALGPVTTPDQPCVSSACFDGAGYPVGGACEGAVSPGVPPVELGACCIGAVCVPGRTPQQCAAAGGVWLGPNTVCTDLSCAGNTPPGGGGGGGGSGSCVIDGGDAYAGGCCECGPSDIGGGDAWTECCPCDSINGGNAFVCCN